MNCENCGGPIQETSGRGRMVCSFCGTIQQATRSEESIDRIDILEQLGEYQCPSCHMQLSKALLEDVIVETCSECQGLLLEREVFHNVVWHRRGTYEGAEEKPIPVSQAELKHQRGCPSCSQRMETHPYYGPGNAVVDSCNKCQFVWLDVGELTTIERAPGIRKVDR